MPPSIDVWPLSLAYMKTTIVYILGKGAQELLTTAGGIQGMAGWLQEKGWETNW